jgi:hypothetical protein
MKLKRLFTKIVPCIENAAGFRGAGGCERRNALVGNRLVKKLIRKPFSQNK